ncbi:hypothetical protein YK48G_22210 [Lentilactobacillus fungorum]|uniref:HTH tetR-type domain-containing protein n=1 Tax=Lentilactobacillus fungorum TaxID=2201250 RepID=A0ABQ3W257_9LACO|nr:TetR/AcrR family transcriptional regulator [Lentilactobacillus fungorum]GHP14796.1 hypothetical protein YK48G_22210 [Lentilactobacillus fungorum]
MKYDLAKKPTLGSRRTLKSFSTTMFQLITKKSFEKITVNEICRLSEYPRATFYNYFDDKYDLLNYCWYLIFTQAGVRADTVVASQDTFEECFDRLYDVFDQYRSIIKLIVRKNPINDELALSFTDYFRRTVKRIFTNSFDESKMTIPLDLIVIQTVELILNVLEWDFLEDHEITRKQTYYYLHVLLLGNPFQDSPCKK